MGDLSGSGKGGLAGIPQGRHEECSWVDKLQEILTDMSVHQVQVLVLSMNSYLWAVEQCGQATITLV